MAIAPTRHDLTIQRRSDHSFIITVEDSNNNPVNLNGYSISSEVWDKERRLKASDATCTITNSAGGTFTWKMTDTQTSQLYFDEYRYDVLLTNPSGLKEYWLEGIIYIDEGYTA